MPDSASLPASDAVVKVCSAEPPESISRRRATIMLVLVTLLWGWSFPLVKNWLTMASQTQCPGGEIIAALTNMALRYPLALALLGVFQFRIYRMSSWRELSVGLFIGLVMSAGSALQVWGLAEATPALSAFLTSLASAWVPLLALGWFRQVIPRLTWLGLALGIGGAAVLARVDGPEGWTLGRGEGLTLAASVFFAVGILLLDRLGGPVPPGHLTVGYLAGTGLPAIIVLADLDRQHAEGASSGARSRAVDGIPHGAGLSLDGRVPAASLGGKGGVDLSFGTGVRGGILSFVWPRFNHVLAADRRRSHPGRQPAGGVAGMAGGTAARYARCCMRDEPGCCPPVFGLDRMRYVSYYRDSGTEARSHLELEGVPALCCELTQEKPDVIATASAGGAFCKSGSPAWQASA